MMSQHDAENQKMSKKENVKVLFRKFMCLLSIKSDFLLTRRALKDFFLFYRPGDCVRGDLWDIWGICKLNINFNFVASKIAQACPNQDEKQNPKSFLHQYSLSACNLEYSIA